MSRLARTLALGVAIALLAVPSALAKPLQPPVPQEARSASSASEPSDTPAILLAAGLGALALGATAYSLGRRREPLPA
jgi:membrane-associated phospholipid phosphatase